MDTPFPGEMPVPQPGMVRPLEGPRPAPKQIPEDLKNIANGLLADLEKPEMMTRRTEVRDVRERREFWNGNHWIYWSEQFQTWRVPQFAAPVTREESDQDMPTAHYVNDYLFYGLDAVSIIAANHAATKFYPQDARKPEDVTAADAATDYIRYFRRKNRDEFLRTKQAYFLYNDGGFFNYVRPVADAAKNGTKTVPVMAEVERPFGQDSYRCLLCGATTPAAPVGPMGGCQDCGGDLDESTFTPAPTVPFPVQVGEEEYPNTEIVLDTYGKLEVRVTPSAETEHDLPYLDLSLEVPRSGLRAMYPQLADRIGLGGGGGGATDNTYEVNARRIIGQGTGLPTIGTVDSLITYKRAWVSPWAYYELSDASAVKKLQEAFPTGFLIVKADDVVCDLREEALVKRWKMCRGLPGTGQNTPSIGSSQLPIQKATNDILNQHIDAAANSIPSLFVDREVVDIDAWSSTILQPGTMYPAVSKPGQTLGGSFVITPSTGPSAEATKLYEYLSQYAGQRSTGVTPTIQGQQTGGAGNTASGYAMMNQQSMKRLSLPWRAMRFCNEETDLLAFDLFRETAMDDLSFVEPGEDGRSEMREIKVDDLTGEVRIVHDTSEEIPATPMEERGLLMNLLQMAAANPAIGGMLLNPTALPYLKSRLALKDLVFPQEWARTKQRTEIEKLLESQPAMGVGPDGSPVPMGASIMPNPLPGLEDHEAHMAEIRDWWESTEGQKQAQMNPMGTANVLLHYQAHEALQQAAMMPPPGMVPPGAPAPGGPNVVPFQKSANAGGGQ